MNTITLTNTRGETFRVVEMETTIQEVLAMLQWQADRLLAIETEENQENDLLLASAIGGRTIAKNLRKRLWEEWSAGIHVVAAPAGKGGAE